MYGLTVLKILKCFFDQITKTKLKSLHNFLSITNLTMIKNLNKLSNKKLYLAIFFLNQIQTLLITNVI